MPRDRSSAWPVLTSYDLKHLRRIALPLGGVGTGTISLGGRGDLRDWETCNRPAKGFVPPGEGRVGPFFAVWVKPRGGKAMARILEGPLDPEDYEGQMGASLPNHGLPRFRQCRFDAAYPLGQVHLSDPDMPITAKLEAFNPLVPADDDASSLPIAVMRYTLTNKTAKPLDASVCGMVPNFIGADGSAAEHSGFGGAASFASRMKGNRNEFRKARGIHGLFLHSTREDKQHEAWGSLSLAVLGAENKAVSHRTAWALLGWGDSTLDFWDDFLADGRVEERAQQGDPAPKATLARSFTIPPRGSKSVTFVIAWHFPNRVSWTPITARKDTDALPATTPFVLTARVSAFQPLTGTIESAELPSDWKAVGLARREFTQGPSGPMLDLHNEISTRQKQTREVVYLVSRFRCAEAMSLDALLGYDGPVKVWVDSKPVMTDTAGTNPAVKDECRVPFHAEQGDHEIVIALDTNLTSAWGVYLRFQRTGVSKKAAERNDLKLPELLDKASVSLTVASESAPPPTACCEGGPGSGGDCGPQNANPNWVGNYYTTLFADAWDVVLKTAPRLAALEKRTVEFVRSFCETDLPETVKEAALYNVSTLRCQTTFRTADGLIFGWEGCFDRGGCCHGSCTHVWNYENAVGYLFGGLSRTFRHVELHHSTDDRGVMAFRTSLPIERARAWLKAAADGQMGAIMRFYRDWKLSGDEKFLRDHWNKAKLALTWCWAPGGWDADQDGVMEGCQHNTMDVEYYGPNPQMQFWYLGAMRAVEEMARHLGETDFAQRCHGLFLRGSAWADKNLFNGEYYEHDITALPPGVTPAPETVIGMGAKDPANPDFQLGAGCLVDQLVGQYMAHTVGLGYLANPANVAATHAAIKRHNFKRGFNDHFNHLRSYVLGDESALLMATYPRGRRPKSPFPYYNEVMTGFEYTAAVGMLFEGQTKDGLECIAAIRERYDGRKRNPFNEAECGHHYARAMASWTAVLALTGFQYSGVTGAMRFAAVKKATTWFWSTGNAWGTVKLTPTKGATRVDLAVRGGEVKLASIEIAGVGIASLPNAKTFTTGKIARVIVKKS